MRVSHNSTGPYVTLPPHIVYEACHRGMILRQLGLHTLKSGGKTAYPYHLALRLKGRSSVRLILSTCYKQSYQRQVQAGRGALKYASLFYSIIYYQNNP